MKTFDVTFSDESAAYASHGRCRECGGYVFLGMNRKTPYDTYAWCSKCGGIPMEQFEVKRTIVVSDKLINPHMCSVCGEKPIIREGILSDYCYCHKCNICWYVKR